MLIQGIKCIPRPGGTFMYRLACWSSIMHAISSSTKDGPKRSCHDVHLMYTMCTCYCACSVCLNAKQKKLVCLSNINKYLMWNETPWFINNMGTVILYLLALRHSWIKTEVIGEIQTHHTHGRKSWVWISVQWNMDFGRQNSHFLGLASCPLTFHYLW